MSSILPYSILSARLTQLTIGPSEPGGPVEFEAQGTQLLTLASATSIGGLMETCCVNANAQLVSGETVKSGRAV